MERANQTKLSLQLGHRTESDAAARAKRASRVPTRDGMYRDQPSSDAKYLSNHISEPASETAPKAI